MSLVDDEITNSTNEVFQSGPTASSILASTEISTEIHQQTAQFIDRIKSEGPEEIIEVDEEQVRQGDVHQQTDGNLENSKISRSKATKLRSFNFKSIRQQKARFWSMKSLKEKQMAMKFAAERQKILIETMILCKKNNWERVKINNGVVTKMETEELNGFALKEIEDSGNGKSGDSESKFMMEKDYEALVDSECWRSRFL